MTKDEIKKALECCQDKEPISCKKCPYEHEIFCDFKISKDALALIAEQEKENDLLKMQLQDAVNHATTFLEEANKFEAENKRLKKEIDFQVQDRARLQREIDELEQRVEEIEQLKAESEQGNVSKILGYNATVEFHDDIISGQPVDIDSKDFEKYAKQFCNRIISINEKEITQAKIDVLNELKEKFGMYYPSAIDDMIERLQK